MSLYEVSHDFCELDLIREVGDRFFLVREEGGEGVDVDVVDSSDMRIGNDDEWQAAESMDAVSKARGKKGECEVR